MRNVNQLPDDENAAPIQPYTSEELRALYRVKARSTWYRWLEKHRAAIGRPVGRYYNIKQVRTIFEKLGPPPPQQDDDGKELIRL